MYDRNALLAAVDLRALADELLGSAGTERRSRMWPCPNPQHAQTGRTPPVSIFTTRHGGQRWRCHGCGEGGTAIDLLLACHGGTTRDAMAYLAHRTGQHEQLDGPRPAPRSTSGRPIVAAGCSDPAGLDRYVMECAARLRTADGHAMRRWLTNVRGLPQDLLIRNRVGADLGPSAQQRPNGMPRAKGIVLPVIDSGSATYAQLRLLDAGPSRRRYLNPSAGLAGNPRLSRIRPVEARQPDVIITEGAIDALSAAAAGYRAVAVLSAGYSHGPVAAALADLPYPLVIAFDADDAGQAAADRLTALLEGLRRPPTRIDLGTGDLNDAMRNSRNWAQDLPHGVADARAKASAAHAASISR